MIVILDIFVLKIHVNLLKELVRIVTEIGYVPHSMTQFVAVMVKPIVTVVLQ
jgi:hypothetical protein